MKYIFMAYGDEKRIDAMPTSERDAFEKACLANDEELHKSGHLLAVEGLQSSAATTVRVQNGKVCISAGPFMETQEQLTGIYFIDARDLNNAIYVASQMPQAREGSIEVRPIIELDPY